MITAIIPARGGSKGIPRKNLYPLKGKPLIQYTIEAAQQSKYIKEIIISTEDQEILSFCRSLGLICDYERPKELTQDGSSMIDVILDVIPHVSFKDIILLQPTSPLRTAIDIDKSIEMYTGNKTNSLISVNKMKESPFNCIYKDDDKIKFLRKSDSCNRQDFQGEYYFINGAIYIFDVIWFYNNRKFVDDNTLLYEMPYCRSIDVDYPEDLKIAEILL
jgi:CMP-N,N'-diacetyllegionaminic acid synthase